MTERVYKEGDQAYLFMTWGSFYKDSPITIKGMIFLAKVTIRKSDWECYFVHIDKVLFDLTHISSFSEGQVSRFAHIWVERGEEAYKIWSSPSNRFAKVEE